MLPKLAYHFTLDETIVFGAEVNFEGVSVFVLKTTTELYIEGYSLDKEVGIKMHCSNLN